MSQKALFACCFLTAGLLLTGCSQTPLPASSPDLQPQALTAASNSAVQWLKGQYRFSSTQNSGCTDSYVDSNDTAYTYDMALAVHAFLLYNDQDKAFRILESFRQRQLGDLASTSQFDGGAWYTAYRCNTTSTSWTPVETFTDVGPTLWVSLAALAYRKKYNVSTFDDMIIKTAEYISKNQWKTQWGGDGGVNFASNRLQNVSSSEHNLDAYAVLKGIQLSGPLLTLANQRLTGDHSVANTLANVDGFLRNKVWNSAEFRLNGGRNDSKFPTDMLSWGGPAFGPYNENLHYSVVKHIVEKTSPPHETAFSVPGYGTRYAVDFIGRTSGKDAWFEGTGQMVVALKMASRFYRSRGWSSTAIDNKANAYLSALTSVQAYTNTSGFTGQGSYRGGLPYSWNATNNTYFDMTRYASVAATSWLIFAEAGYNSFYPDFVNFY